MVLWLKNRNWMFACILGASLVAFIPFARIGVDPHHDGIIFHPAYVLARGGYIHRDVFSQYGQISVFIDALAIKIFGARLLVIRIESAVILCLAIACFAEAWRRIFGLTVAITSALICIATAYFYFPSHDAQMLPWPSDKFLLIQALMVLIVCSSRKHTPKVWFWIGLLSMCMSSIRLQVGIITAVLILFFLLATKQLRNAIALLAGALALVVPAVIASHMLGMTNEWKTQVITWPATWIVNPSLLDVLSTVKTTVALRALRDGFFIVSLAIGGALIFRTRATISSNQKLLLRASRVVVSGVILLVIYMTRLYRIGQTSPLGITPIEGPGFDTTTFSRYPILWATGLGVVLISLPIIFRTWKSVRPKSAQNVSVDEAHRNISLSILWIIGLGSLIQLYPIVDVRHIWWALVPTVGLSLGGLLLSLNLGPTWKFKLVSALLVLILIVQATGSVRHNLETPRVKVDGIPILEGMLIDRQIYTESIEVINTAQPFLEKYSDRPIINLCPDGLYASLTSNTKSADPYFVEWERLTDDVLKKQNYEAFEKRRDQFVKANNPLIWWCKPEDGVNGAKWDITYRWNIKWLTKNLGITQ